MIPAPGTPDGDCLELFAKLVEDYEKDHFKFVRPELVNAIRFRMEEKGLKPRAKGPGVDLGGKLQK